MQDLDFQLVVYHPFRPLADYVSDAGMPPHVARVAWGAVNDAYRTDLPLIHPPHILALAALLYAWGAATSVTATAAEAGPAAGGQDVPDCMAWLVRLNVDVDEVCVCVYVCVCTHM